jgi:hypothetical protein
MAPIHDYPDFSHIRSHIQRAEAQRHYQLGYALADALIATGQWLRRGLSAAAGAAAWAARAGGRRESMHKRFAPHR